MPNGRGDSSNDVGKLRRRKLIGPLIVQRVASPMPKSTRPELRSTIVGCPKLMVTRERCGEWRKSCYIMTIVRLILDQRRQNGCATILSISSMKNCRRLPVIFVVGCIRHLPTTEG